MFTTHIVEDTLFGPFQNRVKRLSGIVVNITARIFFSTVVHRGVPRKVFSNLQVSLVFICHQVCLFLSKTLHPWAKLCDAVTVNQRRAHRTLTLYSYQYRLFFCALATFVCNAFFKAGLPPKYFSSSSTMPCKGGWLSAPGSISSRMAWPIFQAVF